MIVLRINFKIFLKIHNLAFKDAQINFNDTQLVGKYYTLK